MQIKIEPYNTLVLPTEEDIRTQCRPHNGADTCVYLVEAVKTDVGYQCKYNQWTWTFGLKERLLTMEAQRQGCDKVIKFHKHDPSYITPETTYKTFSVDDDGTGTLEENSDPLSDLGGNDPPDLEFPLTSDRY